MRVEILLKDIRIGKRMELGISIKENRHIKVTLKLYRKKRKRTIFVNVNNNSTSIRYKNRRIIQSLSIALQRCYFLFSYYNKSFL